MSLRQRNRLNAMHTTQRTALQLFIDRGFSAVTVEEIAQDVGMAASTVYRHFKSKEALVLWDEHDPAIAKSIGDHLGKHPPFEAVRRAFVQTLGELYSDDLDFQLKRVQFIYATEELHGAAIESDFRARQELADGVAHFLPKKQRELAPIVAGAAMLALDIAMEQWQAADGKVSLGTLLDNAFEQIASVSEIGKTAS